MSSDDQYTALGPAAVGFSTDGANIQQGAAVAGTELGVQGSGPIGVRGEGQIGVLGEGHGGPGGKFTSDDLLLGQISVRPHPMGNVGVLVNTQPKEFAHITSLPIAATEGDFFLGKFSSQTGSTTTSRCALWICVSSSGTHDSPPALWSQVLLGTPVEGRSGDL